MLDAASTLLVMADTVDGALRLRRRRSDAQRSIDAIVSGARTLLRERRDASVEEIAAAAGLTRQTVYAHFSSRDALIAAVINAERAEGLAAVDASDLDRLPPVEALRRFLDISWQIVERCPLVLDPTLARTPGPDGGDPHRPVTALLERIIRRGQRSGEFDRALSARWLAAATIGLGHTAAEEVAAGKLTIGTAASLLDKSVLRLYGANPLATAPAKAAGP
jgi:AcrR family transcriptional regulator